MDTQEFRDNLISFIGNLFKHNKEFPILKSMGSQFDDDLAIAVNFKKPSRACLIIDKSAVQPITSFLSDAGFFFQVFSTTEDLYKDVEAGRIVAYDLRELKYKFKSYKQISDQLRLNMLDDFASFFGILYGQNAHKGLKSIFDKFFFYTVSDFSEMGEKTYKVEFVSQFSNRGFKTIFVNGVDSLSLFLFEYKKWADEYGIFNEPASISDVYPSDFHNVESAKVLGEILVISANSN